MILSPAKPKPMDSETEAILKGNQEVINDIKAGIKVQTAHGIFSPEEAGSDAYVREMIENGRKYLKVYGCQFKYYANAPRGVVAAIQFPKFFLSGFPRNIIAKSKILSLAVIAQFLFTRRNFIKQLTILFGEFNHKIQWFYMIPEAEKEAITEKDYGPVETEIGRALREASKGEGLWEAFFIQLTIFLQLLLYLDNAYRFRAQDAISVRAKTIYNVLDLLASRETSSGVGYKWDFIKFGMQIALFTSPALQRISTKFLEILDVEKMQMTKDDWYWCLKFKSYNFKGMSQTDRYAERERLDREYCTVFLL